jgi:hypothetical protein
MFRKSSRHAKKKSRGEKSIALLLQKTTMMTTVTLAMNKLEPSKTNKKQPAQIPSQKHTPKLQ